MGKLNEITNGWVNKAKQLMDIADPEVEQLAESRLKICEVCEVRTGFICDPLKKGLHVETGKVTNGCGCPLASKTRSVNSTCPLGKW